MARPRNWLAGFKGNPSLKPAGYQIQFTKEQVEERIKCALDPVYFIENYMMITTVDDDIQPFILYQRQKEMVMAFHNHRKVIVQAARQVGKSTSSAGYMLWYILFNKNKTAAVLANKADTSKEILAKVQMGFEMLPWWMQQGVVSWGKTKIVLENGSRVLASSTSSSAIRGFTINLLFLDEFAHIDNKLAEKFFTSTFPTISSGKTTKLIMVSTPNGFNHFFTQWDNAKKGITDIVPFHFSWRDVPGRDDAWSEEQRKVLGTLKWRQEILCEFLGSSLTLIDAEFLAKMSADIPIHDRNGLTIYEAPIKGHKYVMTVDVAHGQFLDYSTFMIIDLNADSNIYRPVAIYRNNEISPLLFPYVIIENAQKYNNAFVLVEINDMGQSVADTLWIDLEYEYMLFSNQALNKSLKPIDIDESGYGSKIAIFHPGVKTTKTTKRLGCSTIKALIESNQFLVNDTNMIFEFSTFIALPDKTYAADEGRHDDLVACTWLFGWLTKQAYYIDLAGNDVQKVLKQQSEAYLDSMMLPVGFHIIGDDNVEVHSGAVWRTVDENTDPYARHYHDNGIMNF